MVLRRLGRGIERRWLGGDDAAEEIVVGSMPPANYVRLHPDAALNRVEKRLLIDALTDLDDE